MQGLGVPRGHRRPCGITYQQHGIAHAAGKEGPGIPEIYVKVSFGLAGVRMCEIVGKQVHFRCVWDQSLPVIVIAWPLSIWWSRASIHASLACGIVKNSQGMMSDGRGTNPPPSRGTLSCFTAEFNSTFS